MDEGEDQIIVFDSYDTVMSANLVKTKLDAFGIPCFLSDENFVGLYPFRNDLFPGVRLHVFRKDLDRIKEILTEQPIVAEELHCPHCGSENIPMPQDKKNFMDTIINSILLSLFLAPKTVYLCQNCSRKFNLQNGPIKSSTP